MPEFNTNTISTLTTENQTFYDRNLLERCLPELYFYEDADKKVIPNGKGTEAEFRKFNSLAIPTTPLEEGVTPTGKSLDITTIKASAKQYGDYVTVSDVLDMQGKDPVITETSGLLGEQAGLLTDTVIRDVVCSGTTVQYANGKASRDALESTDVLKGVDIRKAIKRLKKANIKPFDDGYYHFTIDADQEFDFKNDTDKNGFTEVAKYANTKALLDGEIGTYDKARIRVSSNIEVIKNSTNVEVHKAIGYGRHAYGVTEVKKGKCKPTIIVKPAGSGGTEDPLNQRSTIGWKSFFTAIRLNELGIVRIETGASA